MLVSWRMSSTRNRSSRLKKKAGGVCEKQIVEYHEEIDPRRTHIDDFLKQT